MPEIIGMILGTIVFILLIPFFGRVMFAYFDWADRTMRKMRNIKIRREEPK